jgi:hypothetical protein
VWGIGSEAHRLCRVSAPCLPRTASQSASHKQRWALRLSRAAVYGAIRAPICGQQLTTGRPLPYHLGFNQGKLSRTSQISGAQNTVAQSLTLAAPTGSGARLLANGRMGQSPADWLLYSDAPGDRREAGMRSPVGGLYSLPPTLNLALYPILLALCRPFLAVPPMAA